MIRIYTNNKHFLFLLLAASLVFLGCHAADKKDSTVCIREHCYRVEVAADQEALLTGLMHRDHLDRDSGMLFIFSQATQHSFWMKNTLIPLDMIWLNHVRQVVHIEENVPPCKQEPCPTYTPKRESIYVLELNAGEVKNKGIREGDSFEFNFALDQD